MPPKRPQPIVIASGPLKRLVVGSIALLSSGCLYAGGGSLTTPEDVWADFDATAEPLEEETAREWVENGCRYRELYFTGMTHEGSKVRVFAYYASPATGSNLPAVLHIHGGGQTGNLPTVKFWAEQGYATLSFDYTGRWESRTKFTDWGKLTQGNTAQSGKFLQTTEPSVRASTWYLWSLVSRRALTCLEHQPEVDPKRLGIYGVSNGGSIVWLVAGTDRRVKAACAVYGAGWNSFPEALDDEDTAGKDPRMQAWRRLMEPESYAPLVRCPMLFLNASNDQHGKMDWAFRTLARLGSEWRQAHSPRVRHHICEPEARDLVAWMDTWLRHAEPWPKTSEATLHLDEDGVPEFIIRPDQHSKVERVEIFYAVENRVAKNRFWRTAHSTSKTGAQMSAISAKLPVTDVRQPLFAFANVHYSRGISIGTRLLQAVPAMLGSARATDKPSLILSDFASGSDGWVTSSTATDPLLPVPELLELRSGPGDRSGISVARPISLMTHKPGDPKWRAPSDAALQFQVYVSKPRRLNVTAHEKEFVAGHTKYEYRVDLNPADTWQTIHLQAKLMKTTAGVSLDQWASVNALELNSTGGEAGPEPLYSNFEWSMKSSQLQSGMTPTSANASAITSNTHE